jgi:transposase
VLYSLSDEATEFQIKDRLSFQRFLEHFGHWKTLTFIAGLRLSGMTAPWVLDRVMDGDAFRMYVQHVLAPTLKPGDVVVLDNLPAHKVAGIREAIADRGAQIFYLPPYSPDMNPIEMAFSKKALLRQEPARTVDGLVQRIGSLLDRFLPNECANFFRAAGYQQSSSKCPRARARRHRA